MLTHRRGRDGFMVFLLMVVCCSFFQVCWGLFLVPLFYWNPPARAARGIVFLFFLFVDVVGRYTRELKIQNTSFRLLTACPTGVFLT